MLGYIYVWEHFGGGRHMDVDWSPIFANLYSPKARFQDICVTSMFSLCFSFIGSSDAPTSFTMHLRLQLSIERCESLHH